MDWEKGDTAKAIYEIVRITYDDSGKPESRRTVIKAGDHFTVNDITEGPCQPMLDVGISIPTPNIVCICDKCKPPHYVSAKIEKGEQTFLLASWFVNTNDTMAMVQAMKNRHNNPEEKRKKLLISNPTITPNFLPAKKPKVTKEVPIF